MVMRMVLVEYEYDKLKRQMKLRVPEKVDEECRFLERRGFRFLVDFGYGNAVEKAREYRRQAIRKAECKVTQ